ncbi:MAG TPA: 6-phosphogluconolactonase [Terriglobales bacterium]|jgi:6-phosphogluconolactonase|nr:6-phosphogluconolactonase [Terriglobales bacterium]
MPTQPEIRILKNAADLFEAAAAEFAAQATAAVLASGKFTVALSGGSTPKTLYSLLATKPGIPWDKICFFWGDERHVPPDHPESNYRMANQALLSKVPVRAENIFRIHSEEKDAAAAALQYEQTLKDFFHLSPGVFPRFDLIFLGVGPDGHTASLFPGTSALSEKQRLVVANWVPKFNTDRITFTFPVLNAAACVIFVMSGADKAPILHEVLENAGAGLPSQKVRPANGKLIWMVDEPAASALSRRNP